MQLDTFQVQIAFRHRKAAVVHLARRIVRILATIRTRRRMDLVSLVVISAVHSIRRHVQLAVLSHPIAIATRELVVVVDSNVTLTVAAVVLVTRTGVVAAAIVVLVHSVAVIVVVSKTTVEAVVLVSVVATTAMAAEHSV